MAKNNCIECGQELDSEGYCTNNNCNYILQQSINNSENSSSNSTKDSNQKVKNRIDTRYSNLDEATKQIVLAQDRTTHAIRAVVRFLFIQLSAITLAIIVATFGASIENEFIIFVAVIIYIVGVIWSSNAGWSELEKSNLPRN